MKESCDLNTTWFDRLEWEMEVIPTYPKLHANVYIMQWKDP